MDEYKIKKETYSDGTIKYRPYIIGATDVEIYSFKTYINLADAKKYVDSKRTKPIYMVGSEILDY